MPYAYQDTATLDAAQDTRETAADLRELIRYLVEEPYLLTREEWIRALTVGVDRAFHAHDDLTAAVREELERARRRAAVQLPQGFNLTKYSRPRAKEAAANE